MKKKKKCAHEEKDQTIINHYVKTVEPHVLHSWQLYCKKCGKIIISNNLGYY